MATASAAGDAEQAADGATDTPTAGTIDGSSEVAAQDGDAPAATTQDAAALAPTRPSPQKVALLSLGLNAVDTPPKKLYTIAELESWQRMYLLSDTAERVLVFATQALARKFLVQRAEDPDLECCIVVGLDAAMQGRLFDARNWDMSSGGAAEGGASTMPDAKFPEPEEQAAATLRRHFLFFQNHCYHQVHKLHAMGSLARPGS